MNPNGKVALVTGANSGIGRVTARTLALQGWHVFLACRDLAKTQPVLDEIARTSGGKARAEFLPLDLSDFASVRSCAAQFLSRKLPLQLLVANAGLAGSPGMTKSGFERTFGVCHMGHFLLTQLLLDTIKASAPARIVVVASKAHYRAKGIDFAALRKPTATTTGLPEYMVAKLANVLFANELARKLKGTGVTAYSLHPGVVATDVWRSVPKFAQPLIKLFMLSEEQGAATSLHCALSAEAAKETGLYYDSCKPQEASKLAQDPALARQLWEQSEAWLTT
jgi:NAD(P)-dependent dehydrogenase (short-subunit alcohol dehydrogenase family)